jgi:hypothetical protein
MKRLLLLWLVLATALVARAALSLALWQSSAEKVISRQLPTKGPTKGPAKVCRGAEKVIS